MGKSDGEFNGNGCPPERRGGLYEGNGHRKFKSRRDAGATKRKLRKYIQARPVATT